MASKDDEEKKSIAELCGPLSAQDGKTRYSISGRKIGKAKARFAEDKELLANIKRRIKYSKGKPR